MDQPTLPNSDTQGSSNFKKRAGRPLEDDSKLSQEVKKKREDQRRWSAKHYKTTKKIETIKSPSTSEPRGITTSEDVFDSLLMGNPIILDTSQNINNSLNVSASDSNYAIRNDAAC